MNDETNQSKMAPGTTANAAASAAAAAIDLTDLSVPDANRSEEEPGIVVYQVKKLKWLAIDNTTTARDGGKTLTHPFMEDKKNWLDICLTRQLLLQPYSTEQPDSQRFSWHGENQGKTTAAQFD